MQQINARGTYVVTHACLPHLKAATNPHILTLSPPISPRAALARRPHRLHALQVRHEPARARAGPRSCARPAIASNALWPRTLIATAAVQNLLGGDQAMAVSRKPELYADAAYAVLNRDSRSAPATRTCARTCCAEEGVTDFDQYAYVPGSTPQVDLFVDSL